MKFRITQYKNDTQHLSYCFRVVSENNIIVGNISKGVKIFCNLALYQLMSNFYEL